MWRPAFNPWLIAVAVRPRSARAAWTRSRVVPASIAITPSLVVMNAIQSRGSARYVDIAAALPGISSSTLAETLHALDAARLISRVLQSEDRPSVSYALTQSGAKLLRRLRQLLDEVDSS